MLHHRALNRRRQRTGPPVRADRGKHLLGDKHAIAIFCEIRLVPQIQKTRRLNESEKISVVNSLELGSTTEATERHRGLYFQVFAVF